MPPVDLERPRTSISIFSILHCDSTPRYPCRYHTAVKTYSIHYSCSSAEAAPLQPPGPPAPVHSSSAIGRRASTSHFVCTDPGPGEVTIIPPQIYVIANMGANPEIGIATLCHLLPSGHTHPHCTLHHPPRFVCLDATIINSAMITTWDDFVL